MPVRLSERLIRFSKGWLALIALVIFLIFTALVLPGQAAGSAERTGGARQPDTSLFYTPAELYGMADVFGPDGRQAPRPVCAAARTRREGSPACSARRRPT